MGDNISAAGIGMGNAMHYARAIKESGEACAATKGEMVRKMMIFGGE